MRRPNRPAPQKSARDVALKALGDVVGNGAYAAQALEGMGMEVTGARVRMVSDDQADVAIELVYDGAQRTVEVTV